MYRALADNLQGPRRPHYPAVDFLRTCVLTEEIRRMMAAGERERRVDLDAWREPAVTKEMTAAEPVTESAGGIAG